MNVDELVTRFPRLYHMAYDGSWPSIRRLGLLSTAALVERFGIDGEDRVRLCDRRRPASVEIHNPVYGKAIVRDQKPLNEAVLARVLEDGLTPIDWYRTLNAHVFFWPTEKRLLTLLQARAYRDDPQTILTVDTERLVGLHQAEIRLCPINSGNTLFDARPRGLSTFSTIEAYPYGDWQRRRGPSAAIAEVAVLGGVPDIEAVVVAVARRLGGQLLEQLDPRPTR